jgi:hypothetical protein
VLILDQHGGFQPLHPGVAVFDCTASIASLALELLECRSSILALKSTTRRVIESSQHIPELRNLKESDIEPKVHEYLSKIRASFPHVVVSDKYGMASKNGRSTKRNCHGPFEPKTAAVIELNATVIGRR